MKTRHRILLGFLVVLAAGFFLLVRWIVRDIKPQPMKAAEESLVDTSVLLASFLETRVRDGQLDTADLGPLFDRAQSRQFSAKVYELLKTDISVRVYVTDARGIVIFDSDGGREVGKDYSRWNDVFLTMQGKYGARATRLKPRDFYSTVIYVGAPVMAEGRIAGVVTASKSVEDLKLFITRTSRKIIVAGALACLAAMLVSALVAAWITRPITRLTDYTLALKNGERPAPPDLGRSEVAVLGSAFEELREALEGKKYVDRYVRAFTHEIKSPLASIRGAAELLKEEMPAGDRERFLDNVLKETARIQRLVDQMLQLASLEARKAPGRVEEVDLAEVSREAVEAIAPRLERKGVHLEWKAPAKTPLLGERDLFSLALSNLLANAGDFAPPGGTIRVALEGGPEAVTWSVEDSGPGIPDYAMGKVFDRFYSLPRPDTGEKSTGLGLAIAREAAQLVGGRVSLENLAAGGARATVTFPNPA